MALPDFASYLPGWLGFLLLILVGLAMTINGAANSGLDSVNKLGFILFGLCAVIIGVFSWVTGGTSKIQGKEGTVGVRVGVQNVPWWAWLVDVGVVGVSILIFMVAK